MFIRTKTAAVAAAVVLAPMSVVAATSSAADAAPRTKFANCTALAEVFPHGVAKSPAAAQAQVNQGYGRPATGPRAKKVYRANKANLDRDKDGTACER